MNTDILLNEIVEALELDAAKICDAQNRDKNPVIEWHHWLARELGKEYLLAARVAE